MGSQTLVSVIIPCYNAREEWITRALRSVRNQTYRFYEIVVVDDGSQEEYHEILTKCVKGENERLFSTVNSGVSAARNYGVQNCNGEYICFLDVDDWLEYDALERAISYQEKSGADFLIGGTVKCTDSDIHFCEKYDNAYECFDNDGANELISHLIGIDNTISLPVPNGYIGRGPWARLISRDLAMQIHFDTNLALGEDIVWNIQSIQNARRVCLVRECWYYYWVNTSSKTNSFNEKFCYETEDSIKSLERILDLDDPEIYKALVSRIYEQVNESWDKCLEVLKRTDPSRYKGMKQYVYKSEYWQILCSSRTFKLSSMKMKVVVVCCRLKLFYFLKGVCKSI